MKYSLKELRARHNMSQAELAKLAGVSRQAIAMYEKGEYTPNEKVASKIAEVLKEKITNIKWEG